LIFAVILILSGLLFTYDFISFDEKHQLLTVYSYILKYKFQI